MARYYHLTFTAMANVFQKFQNVTDKPKRNTEDLSFTNNFTTAFGRLTPVFCREVNPGDSISINPSFGLNFAPMTFPVQTKMKAHLHFFYVRNRALWEDWMDFITKSKSNLTPPYIDWDANPHLVEQSDLGDYLNIPTSYIRPAFDDEVALPIDRFPAKYKGQSDFLCSTYPLTIDFNDRSTWVPYGENVVQSYVNRTYESARDTNFSPDGRGQYDLGLRTMQGFLKYFFDVRKDEVQYTYQSQILDLNGDFAEVNRKVAQQAMCILGIYPFTQSLVPDDYDEIEVKDTINIMTSNVYANRSLSGSVRVHALIAVSEQNGPVDSCYLGTDVQVSNNSAQLLLTASTKDFLKRVRYNNAQDDISVNILYSVGQESTDGRTFSYNQNNLESPLFDYVMPLGNQDPQELPHIEIAFGLPSDELQPLTLEIAKRLFSPEVCPLSSLPLRAYECIYNSFYRNAQNNPFILNGQPEYNKFVTKTKGGADTTEYHLYNKNWDDDIFTTAVHSPQQGIAPLVGITSYGEFTFSDENGTYKAQATIAEDGDTITGVQILDQNMPNANSRALVELVSQGVSISDFRNVNALQRWLEKNIRKMRYKDQMETHFGANVRYDELLMPEFLGGCSQEIDVNRVINTTENEYAPLGKYGGLAQAFGGTKHRINHYADEHGFIIGIMSVVPYGIYQQTLPRMFTRFDALDYFFPEFNGIGMQPIYYKDIAPLQLGARITDKENLRKALTETFGYNRPWAEYISTLDEAHGRYRDDFSDYLLMRLFKGVPALNKDFLTIDHTDLNNIWNVSEEVTSDKILGLIHFDFKYKSTVSEYGLPYIR